MGALNEASYKEFRRDETRTTNRKINDSIKNINRIMYEVEKVVEHASRLKTEMAVDQRTLWRESRNRLVKISERINRISKRIHELGA
jgi:methyl-accepting chemotaxis protein